MIFYSWDELDSKWKYETLNAVNNESSKPVVTDFACDLPLNVFSRSLHRRFPVSTSFSDYYISLFTSFVVEYECS